MSLIEKLLSTIKPMIKPAFKNLENQIIDAISTIETKEGEEVAFIIFVRDKKLIIAPVINIEDKIILDKRTDSLFEPQPLVPYILKNFNEMIK